MKRFLSLSCCVFLLSTGLTLAQTNTFISQTNYDYIIDKLNTDGTTTVIVGFDVPGFKEEGHLGPWGIAPQRQAIANGQADVLARLSGFNAEVHRQYVTIPAMALNVDRAALDKLAADPTVTFIEGDGRAIQGTAESMGVIGAPTAHANGAGGSGWAVAVLDTGVDTSHPAFSSPSGKIVAEACYSTNGTNKESLCPGGVSSSTASGSGDDCALSIVGCGHGTWVAGIAVGDGSSIGGVAPDANLIPMQIFTKFTSSGDCSPRPTPCAWARFSDIVAAVDRVAVLAGSHKIAAMNLSFDMTEGPDPFGVSSSNCDGAAGMNALRIAVNTVVSLDIAAVGMAGNHGQGGLAPPACLFFAYGVGSTEDGSSANGNNTVVDAVSWGDGFFTNHWSNMDFWAPGEYITSAYPGNTTFTTRGSSGSAPHVSGAFAALKSLVPSATRTDIYDVLVDTGVQIALPALPATTKPRIAVGAASVTLPTRIFGLDAKVFLQGPYTVTPLTGGGTMSTDLNSGGFLPFDQPYSASVFNGTPLDYDGGEGVLNDPGNGLFFFDFHPNITDWMLLELRTGTGAATAVHTQPVFVKNDGAVVALDGVSAVRFRTADVALGSYYVVMRHRNHLSIMSKNPIVFNGVNSYDFTTGQNKAFGVNPMVDLGGGVFGMRGGEGAIDGSVTAFDFLNAWLPINGSAPGYDLGDFNMDSQATSFDFLNVWLTANGQESQVPGD